LTDTIINEALAYLLAVGLIDWDGATHYKITALGFSRWVECGVEYFI